MTHGRKEQPVVGDWLCESLKLLHTAQSEWPYALRYLNTQRVIDDVAALYAQVGWTWHDRFEAQVFLDDADAEQTWEYVMTAVEHYQEEFC